MAVVAMLDAASAEQVYSGRDASGTLSFTNVPTSEAHEEMHLPEAASSAPEPNVKGPDTPLHAAVRVGKLAEIERLLAEGASVNARGFLGRTPLMTAAFHHRQEAAKVLIARGADLNAVSPQGDTALHLAASHSTEVARVLIAAGADVNVRDKTGRTPLHHAVSSRPEISDALIAAGADRYAADKYGVTPESIGKTPTPPRVSTVRQGPRDWPKAEPRFDPSTRRTTRFEYDKNNNLIRKSINNSVTTYEVNRENQVIRMRTRPR
jgi:hypothetical protein